MKRSLGINIFVGWFRQEQWNWQLWRLCKGLAGAAILKIQNQSRTKNAVIQFPGIYRESSEKKVETWTIAAATLMIEEQDTKVISKHLC